MSPLNLQLDPNVNPILRQSIFYGSHIPKIPNSLKLQTRLIPKPNKIMEAALHPIQYNHQVKIEVILPNPTLPKIRQKRLGSGLQ